jgi:cell division protein FtsQ
LKADNNTEHSSPSTSLRGDRGAERRYNIKNILLTTLWVAIGACTVVLFVAAIRIKELKHCRGIEINISGASNNFFIDKTDVQRIIVEYAGKNAIGRPIENFNLVGMETALKKDVWIKDAELFFDNNEILQVTVEEREPVARIFTPGGNTFYIDSSNMMLPLSEKFSARLPVFTGFPSEAKILSKADSNLLNDIKNISIRIQQDSFLMAMIDQVDITAQRNFEMIPKLGNQVIVFGDASDTENKFKKLQLFYKKVMMQAGWNRYSIINLQYKNQVVAKIKGKDDASADSLRTKQMMEIIAANAARHAEDSTNTIIQDDRKNNDSSMIQQSMQRDESGEISNTDEEPKPQGKLFEPVEKPVTKIVVKPVQKPVAKLPVNTNQKPPAKPGGLKKPGNEKPKIIMPRKNDY